MPPPEKSPYRHLAFARFPHDEKPVYQDMAAGALQFSAVGEARWGELCLPLWQYFRAMATLQFGEHNCLRALNDWQEASSLV